MIKVHVPGVDRALAERIVEHGYFVCPYCYAIRNNVEVETQLI